MEVALVKPEIPPNTGSVGRLCLATGTRLNLVRPLGFSLDDAMLKRAGLDYWKNVDLAVWDDWDTFQAAFRDRRLVLTSARRGELYSKFQFQPEDVLCFGPETTGLPAEIIDLKPGPIIRIPIWGPVRSLNLSIAVGVILYQALSSLDLFPGEPPSETGY